MLQVLTPFWGTKDTRSLCKLETNLDSSVGTQVQYLRSSIPVIDMAFAEMDMQTLPVTLSSHTSCKTLHHQSHTQDTTTQKIPINH